MRILSCRILLREGFGEMEINMIAYLTSSPGGNDIADGKRYPSCLDEANGFVAKLKQHWRENVKLLIISASPDEPELNDSIRDIFAQSFPMSGLPVGAVDICDSRTEALVRDLSAYDVVLLAGGHVPTQNAFFGKIQLKERLKVFDGILIGISAGTMNCAELVYALPELEGESEDRGYQRFLTGLGLTKLMVIPHYQSLKEDVLDGKRVIEDIAYPDSMGREFYALPDGSFLEIENGTTTLCGEGYLIKDGEIRQICEQDACKRLACKYFAGE